MVKSVLFLTEEYSCDALKPFGGIGVFIASLAAELTKNNIAVYVLYVNDKENFSLLDNKVQILGRKIKLSLFHRILKNGIQLINSVFYKQKKGVLLGEKKKGQLIYKAVKTAVQKYSIDIVEVYDYKGLFRGFHSLSVPFVVRCHGSYSIINQEKKGFISLRENEKSAFLIAKNIIGVSNAIASTTKNFFNKTNISVIYNGIDADFFSNRNSNILPYSIFYIGSMSDKKGVAGLVLAFSKILLLCPKATLHLVGSGKKYVEEKIAALHKSVVSHIFHYENIERKKIPGLLSKAHVFTSLSTSEALGLSVLEAMSMEKPVVVTDLPSFREIIEEGVDGFIVENEQAFIDKVLFLFNHPSLAIDIGKKAREKVVANFSMEKMVEDSHKYYTRVLEDFNLK